MRWETAFTMDTSSIKYGAGVTREVGHDMSQWGGRRVMVVTDPYLAAAEPVAVVLEALRDVGDRRGTVRPGPGRAHRRVVPGRHRRSPPKGRFDGYVAVGGGSSIDTAKAANLYATYPAEFLAYVNRADRPGAAGPGHAEAPDRGADHGRDGERDDGRGDLRLHAAARQDGHRAPRAPAGAGPDRPGQHPELRPRSPRARGWTCSAMPSSR